MDDFSRLSELVTVAVRKQLAKAKIHLPLELSHSMLRVDLFLEDRAHVEEDASSMGPCIASVRIINLFVMYRAPGM